MHHLRKRIPIDEWTTFDDLEWLHLLQQLHCPMHQIKAYLPSSFVSHTMQRKKENRNVVCVTCNVVHKIYITWNTYTTIRISKSRQFFSFYNQQLSWKGKLQKKAANKGWKESNQRLRTVDKRLFISRLYFFKNYIEFYNVCSQELKSLSGNAEKKIKFCPVTTEARTIVFMETLFL